MSPRKLKQSLPQHECQTAQQAGLAGKKNGELLLEAERRGFQVLLTVDKGVEHELNLAGRWIATIILRAKSNRRKDLLPLVPACLARLETIQPGQVVRIGP